MLEITRRNRQLIPKTSRINNISFKSNQVHFHGSDNSSSVTVATGYHSNHCVSMPLKLDLERPDQKIVFPWPAWLLWGLALDKPICTECGLDCVMVVKLTTSPNYPGHKREIPGERISLVNIQTPNHFQNTHKPALISKTMTTPAHRARVPNLDPALPPGKQFQDGQASIKGHIFGNQRSVYRQTELAREKAELTDTFCQLWETLSRGYQP